MNRSLTSRFFDISPDLLSISDSRGYFKEVNATFEQVLGYSKDELLSKPYLEFVHPEDIEATKSEMAKLAQGNLSSDFENRYRRKNGEYKWLSWRVQPSNGLHYAVARDITQQKMERAELEVSESRFRQLFEKSPLSIQILSPDGRTLRVNEAFKRLWGFSEEIVNQFLLTEYNIIEDYQLEKLGILPFVKKGLSGEATAIPIRLYDTAELEQLRKGSRARWVEAYIYPIKEPNGAVREAVLMHWDVTERVQSEKTLQLLAETSEFLMASLDPRATLDRIARLAVKRLGDCCVIHLLSEEGEAARVAIACNEKADVSVLEKLCNQGTLEASGFLDPLHAIRSGKAQFIRYLSPEQRESLQFLANFGITSAISVPMKLQDRVIGAISIQALERFYNEQDLSLVQELADRAAFAIQNSRLYEESQKAIRLRDDFLAVASHELKTPLTSLNLQVQGLQRVLGGGLSLAAPEKLQRLLQSSARQLHGLIQLIDELLDISRISGGKLALRPTQVELAGLVREVVGRLTESPEYSSQSIEIVAPTPLLGNWDQFRIEQVVTNLLTNAMRYGNGKPIRVSVTETPDSALISVQDQGIGIAPEDRERIFDRFERAVPGTHFRGLGLGLYITREIVKLHKGAISIESELGKGSVFTVRLPRA